MQDGGAPGSWFSVRDSGIRLVNGVQKGASSMGGLRLPGALWLIGGILSTLLVLVVLDTPGYALLLGVGGTVGLVIGGLLIWRPSADVIRWSNIAGVAWLVAFGWLTVANLDKPTGEMISGLILAALGAVGALLAYIRSRNVATAA